MSLKTMFTRTFKVTTHEEDEVAKLYLANARDEVVTDVTANLILPENLTADETAVRFEAIEPGQEVELGVLSTIEGQEGQIKSYSVTVECSGTAAGEVDNEKISVSVQV